MLIRMTEDFYFTWETTMRKVVLISIVFFIISTILLSSGKSVYSIKEGIISGIGYGNNGERFGSFITCSEPETFHYFEGSNIHFETTVGDNSAIGKDSTLSLGSWIIDFISTNSHSPVRIGGQIIESGLDQNIYTLVGEETFDNICHDIGNTITLTGKCGENMIISFLDSGNEKVGSITPPFGDKEFRMFGSEINCN